MMTPQGESPGQAPSSPERVETVTRFAPSPTGRLHLAFQNVLSGEVFLAAGGRRVPNLGLHIKSLEVAPQPVPPPDSMTTRQRVATAVVRDEKTQRDVTLTHRERHFTGALFAFVAEPGESAAREVRTGDAFKLGEATYRIERIEMTPPSIEVVKESPSLSQPDRRTLTPREIELNEDGEPVAIAP